MKRSDFFKLLGLGFILPSPLTPLKAEKPVEEKLTESINSRWPIYPTIASYIINNGRELRYVEFTYVKINRNNIDYLIPCKSMSIEDKKYAVEHLEHNVKWIQEHYSIDSFMLERGHILLYDPHIHK